MPAKKNSQDQPDTLDREVERFINTLDKLYKEKPAGYFGYLAICGSAMRLSDFTSRGKTEPKDDDES